MRPVLKAFDYAADGFTTERLVPGDERDFGDLAEGLAEAGYIGPALGGEELAGESAGDLAEGLAEAPAAEATSESSKKRGK